MDKQTAKLGARILENLPSDMGMEAMQKWIDDPLSLQSFLRDLNGEASKTDPNNPAAFFQPRLGLWVSPDFRARVLGRVVNISTEVKHIDLSREMSDADIEKMVGPNHLFGDEQVCRTIARLIAAQEEGKEGELLNNGFANLFYTSSCVVFVNWSADDREWRVSAWRRGDSGWSAGLRVFSPGN